MVIPGLSLLAGRQAATPPQLEHGSNGNKLLAIHGTFCGVAVLSVVLRLYVRIFMLKSLGIDDYFIGAAAVSAPTSFARRPKSKAIAVKFELTLVLF